MNIPLIYADIDKKYVINELHMKGDLLKHVMNLGFLKENEIKIMSKKDEDMIVEILGAKIAISGEIAKKIYVREREKEKENGLEK